MAQQSTTFPPGGQLLNWVPGFCTGGLPIRGIRIDNTSGSWLSITIPGLGVQFIPPYTLGWTLSPYLPLSSLTILNQGPFGSNSTTSGTNVSVFGFSDPIGDSSGNTYYTPVLLPFPNAFTGSGLFAPGAFNTAPIVPGVAGKSLRILQMHISINEELLSTIIFRFFDTAIPTFILTKGQLTQTSSFSNEFIDRVLPKGDGVSWYVQNLSSVYSYHINLLIAYVVI